MALALGRWGAQGGGKAWTCVTYDSGTLERAGAAAPLLLGIDTGGTYTDAALLTGDGSIVAESKALTTYHDLAEGIREALTALPAEDLRRVGLVGLSTTLATNAIVEGRGAAVCLLLVGYDRALLDRYAFWPELVTRRVVLVRGGHTAEGDEREPLDVAAVRRAILEQRGQVQAFAVSGYFGVRNPAHELEVKRLVAELSGLPCTCGYELTSQLDSIRRATTVALNARLIPILEALIRRVQAAMAEMAMEAPLMVVRGDGSLMRAQVALERPVETILSGPAASAVGAHYLCGRSDVLAVDMGGTTTDIVFLEDGRPRLNTEGARVGRWRTMVRAADVHTIGLGGDSRVRIDRESRLCVGPRRVIPLSYLGTQEPAALAALQAALGLGERDAELLLLRQGAGPAAERDGDEREILAVLRGGPRTPVQLARSIGRGYVLPRTIERLEAEGALVRAGFTPTDALHVVGRFSPWSVEAAAAGAELLGARVGLAPDALCRAVLERVSDGAVEAIVAKLLEDEDGLAAWPDDAGWAVLRRALGHAPTSGLGCRFELRWPLVAIGAPVGAYMPRVAETLHTELVIPEHAAAANAVGAVVGSVVQVLEAHIAPLGVDERYRLHLGQEVRDFAGLEEAVAWALEHGSAMARARALASGAHTVEVRVQREDRRAEVAAGWGRAVYLGTDLRFTAIGRPEPAEPGLSPH